MLTMRRRRGGMLAVLLVSGVAGAQTPTAPTETADIAALRVRANAGDAAAQAALGYAYVVGQGVPKDAVSAYLWFNLSAASGTGETQKAAAMNRDESEQTLTPTQLESGQTLSREWFAAFEQRGEATDRRSRPYIVGRHRWRRTGCRRGCGGLATVGVLALWQQDGPRQGRHQEGRHHGRGA